MFSSRLIALVCLLNLIPMTLFGDDAVFARQGDVVLTQDELDAAFAQIPVKYRMNFIRNGEKVDQLVQSLLRQKLIAAEAAKNGFDQETLIANRMKLSAEKELSDAWVVNVVENAPKADYEALALENYLAHPESFQTPDMVDVSHILIKSDIRPEEEALETATRLRDELLNKPELFDEYVMEFSEDPAKKNNGGRYPQMQREQMVKPFEDAAFSMIEPGSISELVETAYGYHILRLNAKMPPKTLPFEEVKARLVEEARSGYLSEYEKRYIIGLTTGVIDIPEGAVEAMARRHFGENLELAPGFIE